MLSLAYGIVRCGSRQAFDSSPLGETLDVSWGSMALVSSVWSEALSGPYPSKNLCSACVRFRQGRPPLYKTGFGSFGLPPFRPLMRDCSLPASVFGPVEQPPCHLQRPLM